MFQIIHAVIVSCFMVVNYVTTSCSNLQVGTLRFFGATEFASGTFAGVELDDPVGKNDGSLGGIRYFTCTPKHGRDSVRVQLDLHYPNNLYQFIFYT